MNECRYTLSDNNRNPIFSTTTTKRMEKSIALHVKRNNEPANQKKKKRDKNLIEISHGRERGRERERER